MEVNLFAEFRDTHDQLNADKIARHHYVCSKVSAILVFTYIYFVHIYNKILII